MLINDYKIIKKDDKDLAQEKILNDILKMSGMNKMYLLGFVNAFDAVLTVMNPKFTYERKDILNFFKEMNENNEEFKDINEICNCIIKKYDTTISID